MSASRDNSMSPRWLTWWAYLTVMAVCPLLFLGALVTSMKVGMADQRPVVSPLEAIAEMIRGEQSRGWNVEHSHRLAGWFAGICGIGLAVGFWVGEKGHWFRWLGLVGLALIAGQGLLGIFRVKLNALWGTDLAWIHGIAAQVVFAVLAGLALTVSPSWRSQPGTHPPLTREARPDLPALALRTWSLVCVGLVFGQLVLGGLIRHQPSLLMARVHILGAFLVLAGLLWLAKQTFNEGFGMFGWMLLGLVGLEIVLGVESGINWMARFFNPAFAAGETMTQLLIRTTHYFVGSLVFAVTALVALQAHRPAFSLVRRGQPSPTLPPTADVSAAALAGPSLQGGAA